MRAAAVPRTVHYCWFGGKPLPPAVERYLQNWRTQLPGFEILEWNEQNFDFAGIRYAREAHAAGKYAFVSDVARLHALATMGGIYLDTDVEIMKPLDELLDGGAVLGFEEGDYVATSTMIAPAGSSLVRDFLDSYRERPFLRPDGQLDLTTNVEVLTSMLAGVGLKRDGSEQELVWKGERIRVLDQLKLSPMDYPNGINHADASTFTVHHFGQSWSTAAGKLKTAVRKGLIRIIGGARLKRARKLVDSLKRRFSPHVVSGRK